jgi:hypothetical protein
MKSALVLLTFGLVVLAVAVPVDLNAEDRLVALSELDAEDPVAPAESEGINTASCWRIKSLVRTNGPRQGFEWAVTKLELYTSSDATGTALAGEAIVSSVNENNEGTEGDKAFDGSEDTHWQANGMDSGEYLGIKLAEAKQVRSLKIMQPDDQKSVKQAVLEKSVNCVSWARVAEFPELDNSYGALATFTFESVDTIPSGVFQIRSRVDINMCVGVKPDDAELQDIADGVPQKSLVPGNPLQVQTCNVDVLPQFWSFDGENRLVNAANDATVIQVELDSEGNPAEDGAMTLETCNDDCPDINSSFNYNEGSGDGLFLHRLVTGLVMAPKGGALSDGTELVLTRCTAEGTDAEIAECAEKTFAQWDVPPMFTIETGKRAENCAPYSHSSEVPMPADNRVAVQKACAAKDSCNVYMWADAQTGEDANKGWLCDRLNIVYGGKQGYELGFRVRGS